MYAASTKLSDVIFEDYTMIPLLNRFGISLGVGDLSVEAVCREKNIDTRFFLMLVNTYASESYVPDACVCFGSRGVDEIVSYLENTNDYYSSMALPNIERHFRALHDRSVSGSSNLEYLWIFFQELKSELLGRITYDRERWFPAIRRVGSSAAASEDVATLASIMAELPEDEHAIEDKVDDLTSFFVIHLRGEYDQNLCMAVVTSLMSLEKDIKRNNRIREKVLRPVAASLSGTAGAL